MSYHWASRVDAGLPCIRRSGLVDSSSARGLSSLDDSSILADRPPYHVRFSPSAPPAGYCNRTDEGGLYPRPPSPTYSRRHITDVS